MAAQNSAPNILEARGVTSGYGEKTVVRNLSLTLPAGSSMAILGPNGAGNTTFLKTCSGLLKATSGQILIDGKDVTKRSTHDRVKAGLCHIPDPRGIFPSLTVKENLILQAPRGGASDAIRGAGERPERLQRAAQQQAADQHHRARQHQRQHDAADREIPCAQLLQRGEAQP